MVKLASTALGLLLSDLSEAGDIQVCLCCGRMLVARVTIAAQSLFSQLLLLVTCLFLIQYTVNPLLSTVHLHVMFTAGSYQPQEAPAQ